jgi:hypothetical protein
MKCNVCRVEASLYRQSSTASRCPLCPRWRLGETPNGTPPTLSFRQRADIALACLPDAPYKEMLSRLLKEMLAAIPPSSSESGCKTKDSNAIVEAQKP